tara:strand:- start:2582 stop:3784 length:1203 start_codon:yes stop_codon:yes gene_type:complete
MKIVLFSFYFPPDLGAGSFRAEALCNSLKKKLNSNDEIHVISSHPNRYITHLKHAEDIERDGIIKVHRIKVPLHNRSMISQIRTFIVFAFYAVKLSRELKPDFLIGTSSRLMTGLLTFFCSRIQGINYYIDLRDIFSESISDVLALKNRFIGLIMKYFFVFLEKQVLKSASAVNVVSKGFPEYFENLGLNTSNWSFFPNGVDKEFMNIFSTQIKKKKKIKTILYAGNIGIGQGLEKIIPDILRGLDSNFRFLIIGDGGSLNKLKKNIPNSLECSVEFLLPIERKNLLQYYKEADILFLHLNSIQAFKRVLPSKIFEYASMGKPIIAGVSGFSEEFIRGNIPYAFVFEPCDSQHAIKLILEASNCEVSRISVNEFKENYSRERIMNRMANNIISVIDQSNE